VTSLTRRGFSVQRRIWVLSFCLAPTLNDDSVSSIEAPLSFRIALARPSEMLRLVERNSTSLLARTTHTAITGRSCVARGPVLSSAVLSARDFTAGCSRWQAYAVPPVRLPSSDWQPQTSRRRTEQRESSSPATRTIYIDLEPLYASGFAFSTRHDLQNEIVQAVQRSAWLVGEKVRDVTLGAHLSSFRPRPSLTRLCMPFRHSV
jgi:hypothetical protein